MDRRTFRKKNPEEKKFDLTRYYYDQTQEQHVRRHRDEQATHLYMKITTNKAKIDTIMDNIKYFHEMEQNLIDSDKEKYRPLIDKNNILMSRYQAIINKYEANLFGSGATGEELTAQEDPQSSLPDAHTSQDHLLPANPADPEDRPPMVQAVTEGYYRRPNWWSPTGSPWARGREARRTAEIALLEASNQVETLRKDLEDFDPFISNCIEQQRQIDQNIQNVHNANTQIDRDLYFRLHGQLQIEQKRVGDQQKEINQNLELNQILQKRVDDQQKEINQNLELNQILQKSNPELSNAAKRAYQELADLNRQAESYGWNMADERARSTFETNFFPAYKSLLEELSPELMQMFKTRDIKFVIRAPKQGLDPFRIAAKKNAKGECEVRLLIPSDYGVSGMALRTFDALMEACLRQDEYVSPELRAEITCWIYLVNKKFGSKGFACKRGGYEKYCENFNAGITEAFKQGLIDINTPQEELIDRGHRYAVKNLLDFIASMKRDDREMFLNMKPGGSLQDNCSWKPNQGQQAVEVGSNEFDALEQEAMERKNKGENFIFNVSVTLEDKLMGQLFYPERSERIKSHHEDNLDGGNPCWWSGEVDIVIESDNQTGGTIKKVTRVKDRTGHYRTYNPRYPNRAILYTLELFKRYGYDTSEALIEIKAWVPEKIQPYEGYAPPTLADPQHDVLKDDEFREVNKWLRDQIPTEDVKDLLVQLGAYQKLPT